MKIMDRNEIKNKKIKNSRINGFEAWGGYIDAKKRKLTTQFENQRPQELINEEISSHIFEGISIYVNGYTKPSAEELKRLMMLHGGKYHHYYSSNTSHMIATNLPDSKVKNLNGRKVVFPNWIVDSIKAGKLLPDNDYILYTPEIINNQNRLQLAAVSDSSVKASNVTTTITATTENRNNQEKNFTVISASSGTSNLLISREKNDLMTACSVNKFNESDTSRIISSNNDFPIKTVDPNFISDFYNRSRLHHISTSGQEMKTYVQHLASMQKGKPFLEREKLKKLFFHSQNPPFVGERTIIHLDIDCFFVSVGLKKYPELKGHPVAVTHSKGKRGMPQKGSNIEYEANYYHHRFDQTSQDIHDDQRTLEKQAKISKYSTDYGSLSEIASCSYEARKAGLKNGMFLGEALRLCPNLKTIPYDFEGYSEVSKLLYDIVASYTLDIEAVSCDELYIDCTELLQDVKVTVEDFSHYLRQEIFEKTGCTASAGIGKNMLLARLATKLAKPNGQYILVNEKVQAFMQDQLVKDLPGVGYSMSSKLKQLGINTCGDLQAWSMSKLQHEFGPKTGETLYEHSRGIDNKLVTLEKDRKSVSAEINYGIRFEKEQEIYNFISNLALEVEQRLKKINKKGRSLTLKLLIRKEDAPMQTAKFMGHGICDNISKSVVLKLATDDSKIISSECCTLAKALKLKPEDYRGLGIQVGKLESSMKESGVKMIHQYLEKLDNCTNTMQVTPQILQENTNTNILTVLENTQNFSTQDAYYTQISQIDESVLNALPEDLQKEILCAISKNENHSEKLKKTLNAVQKHECLPGVKSKKSKILSPRKLHRNNHQKILNFEPVSSKNHEISILTHNKKSASLGGETELDKIRELLKDWVITVAAPNEEDLEIFKNYLMQLIEENLEKTDLVLKHFHRLASLAHKHWKDAYLLMLSYVQQKMLQEFGYMLKARDSF